MGYLPGLKIGEIIKMAYQIQLEKNWNQKQLTEFISHKYPIP